MKFSALEEPRFDPQVGDNTAVIQRLEGKLRGKEQELRRAEREEDEAHEAVRHAARKVQSLNDQIAKLASEISDLI